MEINNLIEELEMQMKRLVTFLPEKRRLFYTELEGKMDNRAILLYGPRGVGKTTFLLTMASKMNLLYISADDPIVFSMDFYTLAKNVIVNFDGIIIDEVHSLKNWEQVLKALYDNFPNKIIWVSDSSSILLRKAVADLSRRYVFRRMPLMSLREYVHFETGKVLEKLDSPFEAYLEYSTKVLRELDIMRLFKEYKERGTRPFYTEGNFREKMANVLEKSIYYDIPHIVGNINENGFGVMKAIVSHLLYSKVPTINVETMCREWGIGKQKFYSILSAMEEIGMINIVHKELMPKTYSKGAKILFSDPVMYYTFNGEVGNFREAFVVCALKEKGKIIACKNEEEGDFIFEGIKIEIGGKNKKRKSSDFVLKDDIDVPVRNSIPLWLLGMLW